MKKKLLLALGCTLLLLGWFSAFLLSSMTPDSRLYILGPTLLLGVGMGIMHKTVGGKLTAITIAFTALTALLSMNQLFPSRSISISAFKQRMQASGATGHSVPVEMKGADQSATFASARFLESFADIDIQLFAKLPGPARMMVFDSTGHLYVSIPKLGAIYQLNDKDHDGYSDQAILYHVGMDRPHGLVWDDDKLYVAEPSQVLELQDSDQNNQVDKVRIVLSGLPDDGGHWTRSLTQGMDGFLYLSIGSRCNACAEDDPRRATVLKVDPATGKYSIFARGLRNSVGLTFSPDGKTLWGSDNGRDHLGDDLPPDEINRIVAGGDYGWPYCYGQQIPDPDLGSPDRCQETLVSQVDLPAHSAPLGITFGDQLKAPDEYRHSLYVAFHGSWNRSVPTGYKLIRIPYQNQQMSKSGHEFLRGWLVNGQAWGRPVAPVVGPDGNLYFSDDRADAIYRISWKQPESH